MRQCRQYEDVEETKRPAKRRKGGGFGVCTLSEPLAELLQRPVLPRTKVEPLFAWRMAPSCVVAVPGPAAMLQIMTAKVAGCTLQLCGLEADRAVSTQL